MSEVLDAILQDALAVAIFTAIIGGILFSVFVFLMLLFLAVSLLARAAFRWLTRQSWNSVIVSIERKAFRG